MTKFITTAIFDNYRLIRIHFLGRLIQISISR